MVANFNCLNIIFHIIHRITCIIKKVFYYEETKFPVIQYKDQIWVRAKTVANILRYKNTTKSIRDHVEPEEKKRLSELGSKSKHDEDKRLTYNRQIKECMLRNPFHCDVCNHTHQMASKSQHLRSNKHIKT